MSDTLSLFLESLSPALVETERLGDYAAARGESFGHAAHREMLAHHRIEQHRFKLRMAANQNHLDGMQRRADDAADAERVAAYKATRTPRKPPETPTVIPADRLLQIAVQAAARKKAS